MKKIEPRTLKGFRDFLPPESRKRQYVIEILKKVFESYGFEPLETPTLEYEEILTGKYGEEGEKLMYRFQDQGQRRVAMRYDQTVPLARVAAQYQNELPMPFKRYQIQSVWRAENTQRGRFREFVQSDIDTIGVDTAFSDAEIIAVVSTAYLKLGFKKVKILINDRSVFTNLTASETPQLTDKELIFFVRALDKLKKIGQEKVIDEMESAGIDRQKAKNLLDVVTNHQPTPRIKELMKLLPQFGVATETVEFLPTLARGLDYYTGMILEVEVEDYPVGSVGGGGRYNNLIGMFANKSLPAVGFAFGFDRTIEAMNALDLFPKNLTTSQVLVTIFAPELEKNSLEVAALLRANNINTEVYLDPTAKMEKQMKYADKKKIPFAVVVGPDEAKKNKVALKNLSTGSQEIMRPEELTERLSILDQ